ncbi:MAG TPA: hypothetical protein VD906_00305 [Caulobacteraceae bacterium]|nr:hypothetical protein [Caulobacteraceae bacterium]
MGERISYLDEGKATPPPDPVRVGDIVKTGPNDYPRFKVVALDSGRAWLRNIVTGEDAVVSLEECCWRLDEQNGDERIGRMLREGGKGDRVGPHSPVEPARIDRISSTAGEPQSSF